MEDKSKVTSLLRLAKQFPPQLVSTIKKGNREEDYINHSVIAQRLLQVVGPYDWDFTVPDEGSAGNSFYLVAGYNHYYTTNYGAHRTVWFSARGTSVGAMGNGIEQYHGQSGSWTFSKPNATTVRITKTAGSYGGSGYGFFQLMYNYF